MGGRDNELEQLRARLAEAQRRIAGLERGLYDSRGTDPLTGLPVLDALDRRLAQEIERSRRYGRPLTIAVADVDGFRAITADHGREAGDEIVAAVARLFAEQIRATDVASRSGDDEFVVMLPETTATGALQAFERYFLELEKLRVGAVDRVALSVGIAQWEAGMSQQQLLATASSRVDVARRLGGGRAVASDSP